MKKKTASRKGVAMIWAVLVMLLIALISGGIIFIDRVYYLRERNENYQVQARLYAESAIDIIQNDIKTNTASPYLSDGNTSETFTVEFPDASNWTCTVTVSHSVVDTSSGTPKNSGIIYLTAKVTRKTSGNDLELAEVCAKMSYSSSWKFDGYYNL